MTPLSAADRAGILGLLSVTPSAEAAGSPDVSWDGILSYAGRSLAPLILHGMGERGTAHAPQGVVEILRERRDRVAQAHILQVAVLRAAGGTLDAAGVPFIALKGAALGPQVYPDPVHRPMSDIDLWVAPDRIGDALGALAAHGFHDSARSTLQLPADQVRIEWRLVRAGAPLEVELHARLPSLEGLAWATFGGAWQAGRVVELAGMRTRVLSPEHQLTHVCLHLARRNGFTTGLSHLVDVARIAARWRDSWDWRRMVRDWRQERVAEWILLALVLARDLLGAPVPDDLEGESAGTGWSTMLTLAEAQLWEGRGHQLPVAVERAARNRTPAETRRWLRWRLYGYYWSSPVPRPPGRVLTDGLRRIWHDLTFKVPTYLRGWVQGRLRGATLAEGLALARGRFELERLVVAAGGLASRPDPVPPGPGTPPDIATRPEGQ